MSLLLLDSIFWVHPNFGLGNIICVIRIVLSEWAKHPPPDPKAKVSQVQVEFSSARPRSLIIGFELGYKQEYRSYAGGWLWACRSQSSADLSAIAAISINNQTFEFSRLDTNIARFHVCLVHFQACTFQFSKNQHPPQPQPLDHHHGQCPSSLQWGNSTKYYKTITTAES